MLRRRRNAARGRSMTASQMIRTVAAAAAAFVLLHADTDAPRVEFTDVTARIGIGFARQNGSDGRKWFPEPFGGGVAVLDIDGDRWPDLVFVNARRWDDRGARSPHGLYRNNRDGTFRDVTAGSGLDARDMYGMGVSIADYDNDGRDDIYITAIDGDRLFHNEGGGKFADATESAGIHNANFGVSGAPPSRLR